MSNQMKINVTGGNVAIGTASQGDRSRTQGSASLTSTELEQQFEVARKAIADLANQLQRSPSEQDAVLEQLAALRQKAAEQPARTAEGKGILKGIKDNFSWAYPIIKDLVQVAWPALLVLIER